MKSPIENLTLLSELKAKEISINDLFINPNNPRLMGKKRINNVNDKRIIEVNVQKSVREETQKEGISDIVEKIKRLGFLKIDRIVVREIKGSENKFVILEGNRRITSCKILLEEHNSSIITLSKEIVSSLENIEVLIYSGIDKDIIWLLQGMRHINGIKEWGPLQQSRFLYEMQKEETLKATELNKMTGLGRNSISNKIRAYKAFVYCMDFYHGELEEVNFSLFQEVIFARPIIKEWLQWDDQTETFKNESNLSYILNWFLGDEDGNKRFNRALELRDFLNQALLPANKNFITKFINTEEYTVKEALQDIHTKDAVKNAQQNQLNIDDRLEELEQAISSLNTLPVKKISENDEIHQKYIEKLEELVSTGSFQIALLKGLLKDA